MLVEVIFWKTSLSCTEILGHIDWCSVASEKEFSVETVCRQVTPYGAVRIFYKNAHIQTFLNEFLSEKICVRLEICLVESDSESLVGLIESLHDPAVHLLPEVTYGRVALLPFHKHLMCLFQAWSIFLCILLGHSACNKIIHFLLVDIVELHVTVAYEMVALFTWRLRCLAIEILLPRKHWLADVDSPVIDKSNFHHVVSAGFEKAGNWISEEVVPDMSEVERLVRVRWRELYHDVLSGRWKYSEIPGTGDIREEFVPVKGREQDIQVSFHAVVSRNFRDIGLQPLSDCVSGILRRLVGHSEKREHNEGIISLKFLSGYLYL